MKAQPLWTCHMKLCVVVSGLLSCSAATKQQNTYSNVKHFNLYSDLFLFTIIVINLGAHWLDLAHRRLLCSCYLFLLVGKHTGNKIAHAVPTQVHRIF